MADENSFENLRILNELPIEKLLRIRNSLDSFAQPILYENATHKDYHPEFEAMALHGWNNIKKYDYDDGHYDYDHKGGESKVSSVFALSVTTLSFLAFGGYLLCLIVHAVNNKQQYYPAAAFPGAGAVQPQPAVFISSGVRRPTSQVSSYGRRKRDVEFLSKDFVEKNLRRIQEDELFKALINLCEGYAKWEHLK